MTIPPLEYIEMWWDDQLKKLKEHRDECRIKEENLPQYLAPSESEEA